LSGNLDGQPRFPANAHGSFLFQRIRFKIMQEDSESV
jgi:hypothetical protein